MKKVFIEGAIAPQFVADAIAKHQSKKNIGAHNIFLGQIRADAVGEKQVIGIEYSAYQEMANERIYEIRDDAFIKFDLTCLHIYHSLGKIIAGEICFFVFVSSKRRKQVYDATEYLVNRVKNEVPIFGKEIFTSEEFQWKVNT